jgi:hypothetical protein
MTYLSMTLDRVKEKLAEFNLPLLVAVHPQVNKTFFVEVSVAYLEKITPPEGYEYNYWIDIRPEAIYIDGIGLAKIYDKRS